MKKNFVNVMMGLSTFSLVALGGFSSCCKKKDEPVAKSQKENNNSNGSNTNGDNTNNGNNGGNSNGETPNNGNNNNDNTNNNTPNANTARGVFKGTSFTLEQYSDERYEVTGATKDGELTANGAQKFTITPGATVSIKLKTEGPLRFSAGQIEELDLSSPQPNLTGIQIGNIGLKKINLSGATEATRLSIDGANPITDLDLTALGKLKQFQITKDYDRVVLPQPSSLEKLVAAQHTNVKELNIINQTKLKEFRVPVTNFERIHIDNAPSLTIVRADKSAHLKSIHITNAPKLTDVLLGGNGKLTSVEIVDAPALQKGSNNNGDITGFAIVKKGEELATSDLATLKLSGVKFTEFDPVALQNGNVFHITPSALQTLDLSNTPTTRVLLDLFTGLTSVKFNPQTTRFIQISVDRLVAASSLKAQIFNALPTLTDGSGTFNFVGVNDGNRASFESFKTTLQAKGWRVTNAM